MSTSTTFFQNTGLSSTTSSVAYENTPATFDASSIAVITSVTASKGQYRVFVSAEGARAGMELIPHQSSSNLPKKFIQNLKIESLKAHFLTCLFRSMANLMVFFVPQC